MTDATNSVKRAAAQPPNPFNVEAENRAYLAAANQACAKLGLAMTYADIARQHFDIADREGASQAMEKFLMFARQLAALAKEIKPKPPKEPSS